VGESKANSTIKVTLNPLFFLFLLSSLSSGNDEALLADATDALKPLVNIALQLTSVRQLTGRDAPTVIT